MSDRQEKTRRKLLKLLPRADLEELCQRPAPWHFDRAQLESVVLANWPHDDIAEAVAKLVKAAR